MSTEIRGVTATDSHRMAVNELLYACRVLNLAYRANPESPDGPWRAECPVCKMHSGLSERPLTITANGHLRCSHRCDPAKIIERLLSVESRAPDGNWRHRQDIARLPAK